MYLANRAFRTVPLGLAVLGLGACATTEQVQPDVQITRAESTIRQAEQNGAAEHSPRELELAREKLTEAQNALREEEFVRAERLAEQASADAELAAARAQTTQAEDAVAEVQAAIAALRSEATRR